MYFYIRIRIYIYIYVYKYSYARCQSLFLDALENLNLKFVHSQR